MNVFLVPLDGPRYDLYCEPSSGPDTSVPTGKGRVGRLIDRGAGVFRNVLAEGDAMRHAAGRAEGTAAVSGGRWRRAIARKLADVVAEQRLLWHLRKESDVELHHPDDIRSSEAIIAARALLSRDHDKHRRWCVIDALLTIASTPVALVPGPNVLAYYFIFRAVGHYLSMLGARHGLHEAVWRPSPTPVLTELRAALAFDTDRRCEAVERIGAALGLERLSTFVNGSRA